MLELDAFFIYKRYVAHATKLLNAYFNYKMFTNSSASEIISLRIVFEGW